MSTRTAAWLAGSLLAVAALVIAVFVGNSIATSSDLDACQQTLESRVGAAAFGTPSEGDWDIQTCQAEAGWF